MFPMSVAKRVQETTNLNCTGYGKSEGEQFCRVDCVFKNAIQFTEFYFFT
jgi:hypothetical protein